MFSAKKPLLRKSLRVDSMKGSGVSRSKEESIVELLKALNGTSQSARKSWLSFVALMAYFFVAIASITHTDLLLNTPVKLPILQIEIALDSFFLISPVLFILVHFGVLLHHVMLMHKASALNDLLRTLEPYNKETHPLRLEVSSYFFAQKEAGPDRGVIWKLLLRSMIFLTLNFLPLCLLLYFQIAFLPVHDAMTTFYQQNYVLIDILMMLSVAVSGRGSMRSRWISFFDYGTARRVSNILLNLLLWPAMLFISFCVATLPSVGRSSSAAYFNFDSHMTALFPTKVPFDRSSKTCQEWRGDRCAFWLTAIMFEQPIDYVSGRRPWFSRNLVVTDKQVLLHDRNNKEKRDNKEESESKFSLRGRDLRYATFDRTSFQGFDFTAADLTGASLISAKLREAGFGCAVRGKRIVSYQDSNGINQSYSEDVQDCPNLQYANLSEAELTKDSLKRAILVGVNLSRTSLEDFDFSQVDLSLANLSNANLRGANFKEAILDGADLSDAVFDGAHFIGASIRAANLTRARMVGANLSAADLSGTSLRNADLRAVDMSGALLFGADLAYAYIWQTTPSEQKAYTLASLGGLQLFRPADAELAGIADTVRLLGTFPPWLNSPQERVSSLLDAKKRGGWISTSEAGVWKSLISSATGRAPTDQSVGAYVGELACSKEMLFLGAMQTYFSAGDYYETYTPDEKPILPPGVSTTDIHRYSEFGDYGAADGGCCGREIKEYGQRPNFIAAFYDRIKQPTCASGKYIAPQIIEQVKSALEFIRAREAKQDSHRVEIPDRNVPRSPP
jgi:uncharacterized protein YjbI with pentapeptide repeats